MLDIATLFGVTVVSTENELLTIPLDASQSSLMDHVLPSSSDGGMSANLQLSASATPFAFPGWWHISMSW